MISEGKFLNNVLAGIGGLAITGGSVLGLNELSKQDIPQKSETQQTQQVMQAEPQDVKHVTEPKVTPRKLPSQKIVLNAEDTANFLKAVDIVRELSSKIDLNASLSQNGIGAMTAAGIKEHNQTLEQQVSIQASFPNATNHSEIEQAFENLVNMAAQYANRK
jgi:hypothetical protein